jgi:hypothetical protein
MARDDEPSNPFVRFKQHVDAQIGNGLSSILGLASSSPTSPSQRQLQPRTSLTSDSQASSKATRQGVSGEKEGMQSDGLRRANPPAMDGSRPQRLDLDDDELIAWQHFLLWSNYSPLNAQQFLSPGIDARAAFEDLLYASSGRRMPIRQQSIPPGRLGMDGLPQRQTASSLAWFQNLRDAGVLRAWPMDVYQRSAEDGSRNWNQMFRNNGSWRKQGAGQRRDRGILGYSTAPRTDMGEGDEITPPKMDATGDELERVDVAVQQVLKDVIAGGPFSQASISSVRGGIGKGLAELEKLVEAADGKDSPLLEHLAKLRESAEGDSPQPRQDSDSSLSEADSEGDLYSLLSSTFQDSQRSLNNLFRAMSAAGQEFRNSLESSASDPEQAARDDEPPQENVREYTDAFGGQHREWITTVRDRDGICIGHQRHHVTSWPGKDHERTMSGHAVTTLNKPGDADGHLLSQIKHYAASGDEDIKDTDKVDRKNTKRPAEQPPRPKGGWFW